MGKIEKHEGTNYFMVDDYILDKVLNSIKQIMGVEKFDNIKTLIDTDDKLPDGVTLKNVVIFMTCVIKYGKKFYPQLF